MPQGPSVEVDGKRCTLYYFTGRVLSSQKQKETQVSSQQYGAGNNTHVAVSSTTVDHHEFFLADESGKERAFKMVDFDFPCREGQTLSVVWVIPEGAEEGPYLQVRNHTTDERHQIHPYRIADTFKKPASIVWGSAAALFLLFTFTPLTWFVGLIAAAGALFYFRRRSRQAAKQLLASSALQQLDAELARKQPLAA